MLRQIVLCCTLLFAVSWQAAAGLTATPAGKLPVALDYIVAAYDEEDSIYLIGGNKGPPTYTFSDQILQFNLTTGTSVEVGKCPMQTTNGAGSRSSVTGAIYYFGGALHEPGRDEHTVWMVSSTFNYTRHIMATTNHQVFASIATFTDDEWYIITGMRDECCVSEYISKFTVSTETLEVVAQLPEAVSSTSAAAHGDAIYIFGGSTQEQGEDPGIKAYITKLTPGENYALERLDVQFPFGIHSSTAVTAGDYIYIIGGWGDVTDPEPSAFKFSPNQNTIEEILIENLPLGLSGAASVYVSKTNRIYVFGGLDDNFDRYDDAWYIQLDN